MKTQFEKKYEALSTAVSHYISDGKLEVLEKAFWFGFEAHKQQYRRSGDPYFEHSVQVANTLSELRMDITTIAAALLHDVVEDAGVTLQELRQEFGDDIANLVDGVTKIPDLRFTVETAQAENLRKMVLSMARDIRVVLIKFADRLHNMRTLQFLPEKKQKSIAKETLDVYAPLAHRFGIAFLGEQFEDLSLKFLDPEMYRFIETKAAEMYEDQFTNIEQMKKPILEEMEKLHIPCRIAGKQKNFYSVYLKMKEDNVSFEELHDTVVMRIITQKKEDCYYAVGVVHSLCVPVADRFKDFIASPKSNGYQSLHTTVISKNGSMVEVLIRTEIMDVIADMGIAARWVYKEKLSDKQFTDQLGWIRQFLDLNKESADANEFMQLLKFDLVQDEIFVFTPKGKLINLPVNVTPVDFAFAVHTQIGLQCIGAKVNSKVVSLNTTLHNGDEVQILTSSKPSVQPYWISFVVTSRARTQIHKWLHENQRMQYITLGRELLANELAKYDILLDTVEADYITQHSGYTNVDLLWAALGMHKITPEEIGRRIFPKLYDKQKSRFFPRIPKILRKAPKNQPEPYVIGYGDFPLVVELGKCCMPIPGDKIVGYHNSDKGIEIHRTKCKAISKVLLESKNGVLVEWSKTINKVFPTAIQVTASDRKHLLRDIALTISKMDINIVGIHVEVHGIVAVNDIILEVKDSEQLKDVIQSLLSIKGIQRVKR